MTLAPPAIRRSPWPDAKPLPPIPAHPRCRCTIRAEYRDENGRVIPGDVEIEPKLPADAMGGDKPEYVPPSMAEIEAAVRARFAEVAPEVDPISDRMLGFVDGRVTSYTDALNGRLDAEGHIAEIFGPPPPAPKGGYLAGFENRAKTLDSYLRKVRDMFTIARSPLSPIAAANSIGDLVRYTAIFEPSEYAQGVANTARRMQAAGYRPIKWKNTWDDDVYRGLNTNWRSPDGTIFELQFHTPASFQTKEVNHGFYEQQRELPESDPRYAELDDAMREQTAQLEPPPGALDLRSPPLVAQSIPGGILRSTPNPWHMGFLQAETQQSAVLQGFFAQAQAELEDFLAHGDLSASDAVFYRQLLDEVNRIGAQLDQQGRAWTSDTIPEAFSAGWRTFSSTVVSQAALEALSANTLGLIVGTTDEIRRSIRGAIAQGILQGLSAQDLADRILLSGIVNIPHWPSVAYRAGVIARTETMRAFNEGALGGILDTGARFVRWIASPDEAVCVICAPRHREVFRIGEDVKPALDTSTAMDQLGRMSELTDAERQALMDFWQNAELPADLIERVSQLGHLAIRNLMEARYGITTAGDALREVTAAHYATLLNVLERYARAGIPWRMNPELQRFVFTTEEKTNFYTGSVAPAYMFENSVFVGRTALRYRSSIGGYADFVGAQLDDFGVLMTHEIGHAVDERFGIRKTWMRLYQSASSGTAKAEAVRQLAVTRANLASAESRLASWRLQATGAPSERIARAIRNVEQEVEIYERQIEALQKIVDVAGTPKDLFVSKYALNAVGEDIAESIAMYVLDPAKLRRIAPARYRKLRRLFR